MLLNHNKKGKIFVVGAAMISLLAFGSVSFAGTYSKPLTGWEVSKYEVPSGADITSTGVEVIDNVSEAYEGRGAIHIWSGGTKANGYISYAATTVEELEEGKTYRISGMIKTSQVAWGRPALTLGDTNIATSLASGLTANQWCAFEKDFTVSGSSKELRIQMWNTGNVYLDNLSLKEVTGAGLGEELLENNGLENDFIRVYKTPTVIKDDYENVIVGGDAEMEYSVDGGNTWTVYDENNIPEFSGNVEVLIRYSEDPAKNVNVQKLNFTENTIVSGNFSVSSFEITKNEFKVEGVLNGAENESINIMLVREGESIRSLEKIILVSTFNTDDDGKFSFTAPIADYRGTIKNDGYYTMYLKSQDTDVCKFDKVYFASTPTRIDAIELLKGAGIQGYFERENEFYKVFNAIGFALSDYEKAGVDKAKVMSIFESKVAALGNGLDENNATQEFSKALLLSATGGNNETTMYEILKKHGNAFSFKYGEDVTLEKVLADGSVTSWVSKYLSLKPAQTPDEAKALFNKAYAFYLINNATYGKVADVIKAQEAYLSLSGADYSEYMSLHSQGANKGVEVSKHIVLVASQNPFMDDTTLLQAITDGLKKNSTGNTSGGGGSGGGGGAGGSGGGSGGSANSGNNQIDNSGAGLVVKPATSKVNYFDDLSGYLWAKDAVDTLYEKGIISGKDNRVFAPQDTITRQEFVKMIVSLTDSYDETAECDFDDVDKNAWYYRYVASAVKSGLIYGVTETEFGTDSLITREQIAVIANRILGKSYEGDGNKFSDDEKIGNYAKDAVYNVRKSGIISGYEDNTFKPQNPSTRAEAAVICLNLLNKR